MERLAFVRLRNQNVIVRCTMGSAEPNVGILRDYIDDYSVETDDGDCFNLGWDLSNEELELVYTYLDWVEDGFDDFDDDIDEEDLGGPEE